jgi:hypothetical protein
MDARQPDDRRPHAAMWPHVDSMLAAARDDAAIGRPAAVALHFAARRHRARLIGDLLLAAARAVAAAVARLVSRETATPAVNRPAFRRNGSINGSGADVF